MAIEYEISYQPQGATLAKFHQSDEKRRFIMGPLGSGKTISMAAEVFDKICEQPVDQNGVRLSRWAAVRNTYPDLVTTTIKDWREIAGDELGKFTMTSPAIHALDFKLEDGTRVKAEMIFLALDRPEDVRKLRGLQLTGAWLNEVKELPFAVVQMTFSRCGRYPRRSEVPNFWYGIIGDTNAPDEDHWYYHLAEEEKPEGWAFFRQPGGVIKVGEKWEPNPDAENINNLPPDYYITQVHGNKPDWVKVNLANEYGFVMDGKPVYPEFVDSFHVSSDILQPIPGQPIYIGIDFGRTPAALFGQKDVLGRWLIIDELVTFDMGAIRFGELLSAKMRTDYPGYTFNVTGDPAGAQMTQVDDSTPFLMLQKAGIQARPAETNDPMIRREATAATLTRIIDGKPGCVVSPKCKTYRKGMAGGFVFKRIQVSGDERFQDKPDKNKYSHICEAGDYMFLGGGEGRAVIRTSGSFHESVTVDSGFNPFDA